MLWWFTQSIRGRERERFNTLYSSSVTLSHSYPIITVRERTREREREGDREREREGDREREREL